MIRKQFRRNAGQLKSSNLDFMLLWNFAQTYLFWDTTDWSSFGELTILYICHWLWLEVEFELQWTSWRCVVHDTSYSLDYSGHLLYHFLTYSLWSASVINGCIHLIFQLFLYLYNMLVMESLYFAQNSRINFLVSMLCLSRMTERIYNKYFLIYHPSDCENRFQQIFNFNPSALLVSNFCFPINQWIYQRQEN